LPWTMPFSLPRSTGMIGGATKTEVANPWMNVTNAQ
jgi:hypothetical protein